MAYINALKTAEIRKALKAAFPGYKFSVRNENHSSVHVKIVSAPIDLIGLVQKEIRHFGRIVNNEISERGYCQVNQYHIDTHFQPEAAEILNKIVAICNDGNHDNSDIQTDYFDVGWYFHLSIGSWDKPFIVKE